MQAFTYVLIHFTAQDTFTNIAFLLKYIIH